MANPNSPFGLRPTGRNRSGGPVELNPYIKASADGTAIFQNDAVTITVANRISANVTPGTSLYAGVALNYGALSTLTNHAVIDQPDAVFEVQTDGSATFAESSGLQMNANLSVATAGNASTKISGHALSTTSLAVGSTLDVKVFQLGREAVPNSTNTVAGVTYGLQIGNDLGIYAKVLIVFNKHRMTAGAQIAGI